ncbi:type II secretion system F family protein [Allosphingosinicella sp.]|jgi:tight adherence protein B|uniref:type II secretion system F family protein n=1 Tax=Allosphingosinicella sp. TaxID=2823234 RepID=UPI002EEBEA15
MPSFPIIIMAAGLFGTLLLAFFAVSGPSTRKAQARRLDSVCERHSKSNEVAAQAQLKRILGGRQANRMDGLAQRLIPNPALLRQRLERTGRTWTLGQYVMVSGGVTMVVMAVLLMKGMPFLLVLFLSLFAGVGVPHIVVSKLIKKRVAKFTAKFPDAIDLMVRGLRSGLPISETMGIVADEIPGPVAIEFRAVSDKMKIGRTMDAALQETAERLATPEFQFFVIALAIQRETGGNLAETLGNLSEVLRKRAAMKLKIRAMSSESKASAWIVGSLPFIVFVLIWFVNGKYLSGFFSDERLMMAGLGGLCWMGIGVFIMAKMVNFEI